MATVAGEIEQPQHHRDDAEQLADSAEGVDLGRVHGRRIAHQEPGRPAHARHGPGSRRLGSTRQPRLRAAKQAPARRCEEAVKLSDPGAAALIGAGAALAGVMLTSAVTFVIDSRRRSREDDRRWYDARRLAYVNFHYTARRALGSGRAAQFSVSVAERKERGNTSKPDLELDSLIKMVQV